MGLRKKKKLLETEIAGIKMKNPLIVCSGTFGYGKEYSGLIDLDMLGAVVTKTVTLKPRKGNPPPRIMETACGILNSIGLENAGIEKFLDEKLPFLEKFKTRVIVSIAGESAGEYASLAGILDKENVDGIELNLSCPNTGRKELFAQDRDTVYEITKKTKKRTDKPVIIKLSADVADIGAIAGKAEEAGADAISAINTVQGMAVDVSTRKPVFSNVVAGLSGPAIKPIALRAVWQASGSVKIPVIGMGGIMNAEDALEFILAGASAVGIGTALFVDPSSPGKIIKGIESYLVKNGIDGIGKIVGMMNA